MDKGFLNRKSASNKLGVSGLIEKGSLLGDLASKIRNIDGKILGRDGKPMVARRCVRFAETTKVSTCGDGHNVVNDSCMVKDSSRAEVQQAISGNQKCMDNGDANLHSLESKSTMMTSPSIHTNYVQSELNSSSNVALPMAAIDEINARFVNTLYGFPVGKRLSFPMVENYVKHAWAKFGLKRVMMHHGSFMFQFEAKDGMEKVLESGPWRIQLVPLVLKVWTPNTLIMKDHVSSVPLWVKMHNVPIVAYSKVGLDLISAKVGRLMRLDAHTSFICLNSWGRSEYARSLVEVSAEVPLVDSVDIDIPLKDGKGYTTVNIRIEYEWKPPRCGKCKIFDHLESVCPMKPKAGPMKKSELQTDVMKNKRPVHSTGNINKGKQVSTQRYIKGYRVNVPKTKLVYRAVIKPQAENNVASNMGKSSDTTKKPSPSDSSKEGKSTFINDDISLADLRSFVVKSANEESVLEYVGNNDINGCTLGDKQGDQISTKKPNSSMEVLNADSDTDVDEVFIPNVGTTLPSSSGGGGHPLEEDDYDAYEDQFQEYPGLFQEFCDQFDFKVKGIGRK